MTTILQLAGLPDSNEIVLETTDETGARRFLDFAWLSPLLEPLDPSRFRHLKLLYGGADNPINVNIRPDIVYNSISDPERCLHALDRAQHAARSNPYPFINPPANIPRIRPDRLFEFVSPLKGITMPKTVRLTPHSLSDVQNVLAMSFLKPPILFKEAATYPERPNHYILENFDDLHALERFAFDGRAYYASTFSDYRSPDGLYRLYRFYVIGDTQLPGHLILSDQWYIRNDEEAHRGLKPKMTSVLSEEKAFLKQFKKKSFPILSMLKKQLGLDYFAVECTIDKKGELLLFSIDCNGHYADGTKAQGYYSTKELAQFNLAVEKMLLEKRPSPKEHHA
ncbi:hypothetical protein LOH54_09020 [Sulfurimonas sp. HSL-3221]|uniref:hypothetical protein n=1 Tax=Thiomicrolovo sulfuroxydans TaxID=2894755 RepID=UPI001E5A923B|nr:hypothetical protein [Sulfurimonas sp. HSL-3221]UFS61798.1 hypothetical protein LOH54_09020 [Sulfurimonas sp. HSL-3221]